jgi:hypothetical protein
MYQQSNEASTKCRLAITLRTINLMVVLLAAGSSLTSQAQNNFNSGSTGADGAFAPSANQTISVPASGVFNFTTVNVPAGVTITFTPNSLNTPLTILSTGSVTVAGSLVVNGQSATTTGPGGTGGPGGFSGGLGGFGLPNYSGNPGSGPGSGTAGKKGTTYGQGGGGAGFNIAGGNGGFEAGSVGLGGPKYGTDTLLPLIGGSGGGGGGAQQNGRGGSGGGGGGAILIASSDTITFSGSAAINAQGGNGANSPTTSTGAGGAGSGGAIRLIANTITGTATLNVNAGTAGGGCNYGGCGGLGGLGYVRIEAYNYSAFTPSGSNLSYALPNPVGLTTQPQLRISSVAGITAPATPLGSFQGVPDVIVPAAQSNPVTVALQGTNIPVGTVVQVTLIPAFGARTTVTSGPLTGTDPSSTASASITLPAGMNVITATAVCDLTLAYAKPMFMDGERVNRVEVAAVFGGTSEVTYVTQSGRRIRKSD